MAFDKTVHANPVEMWEHHAKIHEAREHKRHRREIAAQIFSSLMSTSEAQERKVETVIHCAVDYADMLLMELEKPSVFDQNQEQHKASGRSEKENEAARNGDASSGR